MPFLNSVRGTYGATGQIKPVAKDGLTPSSAFTSGVEAIGKTTTGWRYFTFGGVTRQYWVDMEYSGGGWICVASHVRDSGISDNGNVSNLTFARFATNNEVIARNPGTYGVSSNPSGVGSLWASLSIWDAIASANNSGRNVAYYTSGSYVNLGSTGSHSRRSRWTWTGWGPTYAWQGASNLSNEVGATTPGFWSYHIVDGYRFETTDSNISGCPSNYSNAPFWYGGCWDGNFWGGGENAQGYADAVFWTGSSTDNYNYGAVYIK